MQVLHGVEEPGQRVRVARALAGAGDAAEPPLRLAPGLVRRHAVAEVFGDALLDVKAGFFVKRVRVVRAAKRGAEPADPSHGVSS